MNQRALLLVNRQARQGQEALDRVMGQLQEVGLQLLEVPASQASRLSDVIRGHRNKVDLVIIGGGDGTLNAAADGLVETQLPLGILPLGTANDLVRSLGIPTDLTEACQVIAAGNTKRIDLGWVNGKHFFNVASLGLTVAITRQLSKEAKGRWGVLAYLLTAAHVVFSARPFRARIRCQGESVWVRTIQIAVGNGRYYGGGLTVSQEAAIDDGVLDLYSLEVKDWWQLIPLLPALCRGNLTSWPEVRTLRGREFEVVLSRRRSINTDGEITTRTPAHFRVVPQALSVFAPPQNK